MTQHMNEIYWVIAMWKVRRHFCKSPFKSWRFLWKNIYVGFSSKQLRWISNRKKKKPLNWVFAVTESQTLLEIQYFNSDSVFLSSALTVEPWVRVMFSMTIYFPNLHWPSERTKNTSWSPYGKLSHYTNWHLKAV